ncbi:RNA-binding protein 44 [Pelobates fuscus]|uniref:RNA-binding protein 44 n=1 Tax=Pelobates fuscus TaxID=191477 RepID=UPI002FE4D539
MTQRAMKAELQLLNTQLWLCQQMCWKNHQKTMEKQCVLGIPKVLEEQPETSPRFNLQSALAELEEKYKENKELILSGVPLDKIPPLSTQLSKIDCLEEQFCGCPSNTSQPDRDNEVSTGYLGDQIHVNQEPKEDVAVCSVLPAETKDKPKEEKEAQQSEPCKDEQTKHYVFVGNIAQSINEEAIMSHFKIYQISSVFFQELSRNSSCAILTFNSLEHAMDAVREMNGKELCGRVMKVRFIKDSKQKASLDVKPLQTFSESEPNKSHSSSAELNPSSLKSVSPTDNVPVKSSGSLPLSDINKVEAVSSNTHRASYVPPKAPVQTSSAVPSWSTYGPPSIKPVMQPWMMQSVITKWTPYNTQNQWPIHYSGHPIWFPTASHASSQQVPCVVTKPVTNRSRCTPDAKVKSSSTLTFCKDGRMQVSPIQPNNDMLNSSGLVFSSGSRASTLQSSAVQIGSKSNIPYSSTAVKETCKASTIETAGVSNVAPLSIPSNTATPRATVEPSAGTFKMPVTSSVPPTVNGTSTLRTAKVSPSVSEHVHHAATGSSNLIRVPLRAPNFIPLTVNIPEHVTSGTSVRGMSSVTTCTTADLSFPSQIPVVSSPLHMTNDVPRTAPSLHGSNAEQHPLCHQESVITDSDTCPELDPLTEFPTVIIPNRLNLSTFTRVMKQLMELHPDVTRDHIVETMKEIRKRTGRSLNGLTIREMVSVVSRELSKSKSSKTT